MLSTAAMSAYAKERNDLERLAAVRCPRTLRDALVKQLMRLVEAEAACHLSGHLTAAGPCFTQLVAHGVTAEVPPVLPVGAVPGAPDFLQPHPREARGAIEVHVPYPPGDGPPSLTRLPFLPPGLRHELRLAFYEGSRFLGCLAFFRRSAAFPARAKRRLSSLKEAIRALLLRASTSGAGLERQGMLILVGQELEMVSPHATAWLRCAFGDDPGPRLGAMLERAGGLPVVCDEVELESEALEGPSRRGLGLALRPATPLTLSPGSLLSPMQREVAEHAAVGATLEEIARSLGAGVETVRSHLREVYRRLDVGSRAELARIIAP